MMIRCLIAFALFSVCAFCKENYAFEGRHFIASYCGCSEKAISDVKTLERVMAEAVKASGATVLGSTAHHFEPNGLTLVFLLSESHASIHTYPEHRCCFVDLFTCGNRCSAEEFDNLLRHHLKPQAVHFQVLLRN